MKSGSAMIRIALFVALGLGGVHASSRAQRQAQQEITISVPGIPGPYCMYGIEKRLGEIPEVDGVRLIWERDAIRVRLKPGATVTREVIQEAIERAEYPYRFSVSM
jgi:hypothetical protein